MYCLKTFWDALLLLELRINMLQHIVTCVGVQIYGGHIAEEI